MSTGFGIVIREKSSMTFSEIRISARHSITFRTVIFVMGSVLTATSCPAIGAGTNAYVRLGHAQKCPTDLFSQDLITTDPATHGCMFVPVVLGSDKTTVSVATGQQEYHPVYLSIGNVRNNIRRAHKNALVLIGFLPIPKGNKQSSLAAQYLCRTIGPRKDTDNDEFRDFKRQLFHGCLKKILKSLKKYMTKWDVVRCADNHFRRVIYGIGPYIADYPEQVLIAGIVNGWCPVYLNFYLVLTICSRNRRCDAPATDLDSPGAELRTPEKAAALFKTKSADELWFDHGLISDLRVRPGCPIRSQILPRCLQPFTSDFPCANVYELLTPDLLHQAIKGTFKDHLISWVQEYLVKQHGPTEAKCMLDEIDQRLVLMFAARLFSI